MKNTIAILGIATLAAAATPQLQAGHVSFSIGGSFSLPVPVFSSRVYVAPPVFVPTAPAVCAPPIVPLARVYVPPPVCAAPRLPVYYAPARYYGAPGLGIRLRFGRSYHPHCR